MIQPGRIPVREDRKPIRAGERERARYDSFREQLAIDDDVDAVAMYLTSLLLESALNGKQLRYRLRLLDTAALTRGHRRPSQERLLRAFVLGLHREAALGPEGTRSPLYGEMVRALVDAIGRDRRVQARDIAFLLLANTTGLPGAVLRGLTWDQVRFRKNHLVISIPHRVHGRGQFGRLGIASGPAPCAVAAVRDLRRHIGPVNGPMFGTSRGRPPSASTLHEVLRLLPARGEDWHKSLPVAGAEVLEAAVVQLGQPTATQLRDKVVLTLGFTACLQAHEALALCVGDVVQEPRGLIVRLGDRSRDTAIPYASDPRYCAVRAWLAWEKHLGRRGLAQPELPALPRIYGRRITSHRLDAERLTDIVRNWSERAGMPGDFTFTSLRIGFIRSAARAGVRDDQVLRHANLRWLRSVEIHRQRELLVSHSVAGRVGL